MTSFSTLSRSSPGSFAYSASTRAARHRCQECSASFSCRRLSMQSVCRTISFSLSASRRKPICRSSRSHVIGRSYREHPRLASLLVALEAFVHRRRDPQVADGEAGRDPVAQRRFEGPPELQEDDADDALHAEHRDRMLPEKGEGAPG